MLQIAILTLLYPGFFELLYPGGGGAFLPAGHNLKIGLC